MHRISTGHIISLEVPLRRSVDPMILPNLVFGSAVAVAADRLVGGSLPGQVQGSIAGAVLGFAGDFYLGGAYTYSPLAVSVTLSPTQPETSEETP